MLSISGNRINKRLGNGLLLGKQFNDFGLLRHPVLYWRGILLIDLEACVVSRLIACRITRTDERGVAEQEKMKKGGKGTKLQTSMWSWVTLAGTNLVEDACGRDARTKLLRLTLVGVF